MTVPPIKVGLIGCGNISTAYLNIQKRFPILDFVACADLCLERAQKRAEEFEIPQACSVQEILSSHEIDIILNLTTPAAHTEVNLAALAAGKHVYTEKPLALNLDDSSTVLAEAEERDLRVGCAPDTFLGGAHQTARKLIDDGWIGKPVAATAFMTCRGHESWHPDPEFYYQAGGGPMLDMGPYYLTALVNLLGGIKRICGISKKSFSRRTITSQPKRGVEIDVEVDTHVAGTMEMHSGAIVTVVMSFDIVAANLPRIEVYGSEGTMSVPDPNGFGGEVFVQRMGTDKMSVPLTHGYAENSRSVGLADMAFAIQANRPHRASGQLANHVLEAMLAFMESSARESFISLQSNVERPAPLPTGLLDGQLDQ